jgi:hypothetical protein
MKSPESSHRVSLSWAQPESSGLHLQCADIECKWPSCQIKVVSVVFHVHKFVSAECPLTSIMAVISTRGNSY